MTNRRLPWWLATLVGVAGGAALAFWVPAGGGPILCLFRRTLELPCPGCGLTRAFGHLARGDLAAALALHPLAPLLAGELALGWGYLGLMVHGYRKPPRRMTVDRWITTTGYLLLAVWMGRLAAGDLAAVQL